MVQIPAALAHVLRQEPQLVAAAVDAFYRRDADGVRAAARMAVAPPTDLVAALVPMNRAHYAQLVQQRYDAPRGWPAAPASAVAAKASALGAKLAAGFEILAADGERIERATGGSLGLDIGLGYAWLGMIVWGNFGRKGG